MSRSPYIVALLLAVAPTPALVQECQFPQRTPVEQDGRTQFLFTDTCGRPYEIGYRLDGNTLHFPHGGMHRLPKASSEEAERILRETYGLKGERSALIRTKDL